MELESKIFKFDGARNFCRPRYVEIRSYLQYTNKEKYGQIFLSVKNSNSKVSLRYQSIAYNSTKKIMMFLSKEMKERLFLMLCSYFRTRISKKEGANHRQVIT